MRKVENREKEKTGKNGESGDRVEQETVETE